MLIAKDIRAEGIPSAVSSAIRKLDEAGVPMHSLLVAKSSEIIAEAYWEPYGRDTLHRLYSCTKSFVSLAIGTLIGQGRLSLYDHIVSYFPDMLPSSVPPELEALTIRNMLMMRTCYRTTTYKAGGRSSYIPSWQKEWVRSFFSSKPDHDPGMFFIYDTSSTHVLASLVERVSGTDFVSFIRSTFLSGLDISGDTYITKDPEGRPAGGSGLMMRPIDLLKVIDGVMHKTLAGIPDWYIDAAVSRLSENELSAAEDDLKAGYGYQFWRLSHDSWCMYGMGGQFAIAIPDRDIAIVTTADTQADKTMMGRIFDAVWEIAEGLDDTRGPLPRLSLVCSRGRYSEAGIRAFDGRRYSFPEGNMLRLRGISFSFTDYGGCVDIAREDGDFHFDFGFGRNVRNSFPVRQSSICYASGGFLPDGSFTLFVQFAHEELGSMKLVAAQSGDSLSVMMHLYGELSIDGFEGVAKGTI